MKLPRKYVGGKPGPLIYQIADGRGDTVTILERITQMGLGVEWEPWAEKGWTLHETPDGQVMAVNGAMRMATERAQRFATLISRLRKSTFSYGEFLAFKKSHMP